jgi:hypothetical protein
MEIKYKRGVWYVLEPGKDYVTFNSQQEAEDYVNPPVIPEESEWETLEEI